MEHLPPWLRHAPLPPQPPQDNGDSATPEWLRDLDAPAAPPLKAEPARSAPPSGEAVPEWLRDLESEVESPLAHESAPSAAPHPDEIPEWLHTGPEQPAAGDPQAPSGVTSWLRGLGGDPQPPQPPAAPPADEQPPTTTTSRIRMPVGATDWLRSIGQEPDVDEELRRAKQEREAAAPPDEAEKAASPTGCAT